MSPIFKVLKAQVELETWRKHKCLRTYNRGEYVDSELEFCKNQSIVRQFRVTHTPKQNRVAEQVNKTLQERTRAMLIITGMSKSFWAEAVKTAYYVIKKSPTTIDLKTLMEM